MPSRQTDDFLLQKKLEKKNELVARPAFVRKIIDCGSIARGYHITKSLTAYVSMYFHIANCSFFLGSLMLSYDILTVQSQTAFKDSNRQFL